MIKYAFICVLAVMLDNWHGKSVSQSTNTTQFLKSLVIHVYDSTNTKTEIKGEMSLNLDYQFRV